MSWLTTNRLGAFLVAAAIWAGIYLPRLGGTGFQGEEPRRVLPAVSMLETGRWIVPTVAGEDYHKKPPGINWLVAASFAITGEQNEMTARLPSSALILAFVALLIWMPSNWLSVTGRLVSAAAFLTVAGMLEKGRQIEMEATYICFTGMALVWWMNVWSFIRLEPEPGEVVEAGGKWPGPTGAQRWALWIVPALFLACGALIKGPLHGAVFYGMVFGVLVYHRRLGELFKIQHICAVAIICVLCLGWLLLARALTSASEMSNTMQSQLGSRFFPKDRHVNWHWTFPGTLKDLLPWSIFLPLLWVPRFVRLIPERHRKTFKGARLGFVIGFVLLAGIPAGVPRYAMPVQPMAILLIGWVLSRHVEPVRTDAMWRNGILIAALCIPAGAIAATIVFGWDVYAYAAVAISLVVLAAILGNYRQLVGGSSLALATAWTVLAGVWLYIAFGLPLVYKLDPYPVNSQRINELVPAGETAYVYRPQHLTFLFRLRDVDYVTNPSQVDGDVRYLIVNDVAREDPNMVRVLEKRQARGIYLFMDGDESFELMRLDKPPLPPGGAATAPTTSPARATSGSARGPTR